ncbi:MAG: hypothetical protein ACLFPQ_00065 [Candidatus Woesearchaeota archaeon]
MDLEYYKTELKDKRGFDIDSFSDSLGRPIDEKIKPLVAALMARGYNLEGSCEGHPLGEQISRLRGDYEIADMDSYEALIHFGNPAFFEFFSRVVINESPYVDMGYVGNDPKKDLLYLDAVVEEYNSFPSTNIRWKLVPDKEGGFTKLTTELRKSLSEKQDSIDDLADYILKI